MRDTDPAEGIVSVVAAVLGGVRAAVARIGSHLGPSEAQLRRWREAARAAGVAGLSESAGGLAGWAGPLRVRLSRYGDSESSGTRITVSGPALPAGLTIRPEGLASAVRGARGLREVEIGHDTFDAAAWVEGNTTVARAVLDAGTRRALRALFGGRLERPGRTPFWASGFFQDGVLRVDVPQDPPSRGPRLADSHEPGEDPGAYVYLGGQEHLPEVLAEVLALARQLATPEDLARRLADNLKTEPVAPVRLQCLATLAREFADHPATGEALLAASEDPDAEVRLRAGIALGPKGRDVLLAIARGEGAEDATTERAVLALGFFLTTDEAQGILRNALRTRREATARALGPVGTPGAVLPLKELEARDGGARAAARQAIAEIQGRARGAGPGQLSLAAGESGQLSLAGGEEGRLSLPPSAERQ